MELGMIECSEHLSFLSDYLHFSKISENLAVPEHIQHFFLIKLLDFAFLNAFLFLTFHILFLLLSKGPDSFAVLLVFWHLLFWNLQIARIHDRIDLDTVRNHVRSHRLWSQSVIVLQSQILYDNLKIMILFLHFLMVAATLLSLPGIDEDLHRFEYFVHSSQMPIDKVPKVYF